MKKTIIKVVALAMIAVMACMLLVACAPASDPDKAIEALKDNGYAAAEDKLLIPGALKLLGVKDIDCVVAGTKEGEAITIIYFADKDAAEAAWEKVSEYAEDQKDDESDWVVDKSGAMIYFGTKQAVKDAR